jgi:dihydroorotate dehydrogenase (fumarate)
MFSFDPPIMNASGCLCTEATELDALLTSRAGAVVSKSSTLAPRRGNPQPRLALDDFGSLNSVGLENHGYEYYSHYFHSSKLFIQSIYPFDDEEMERMLLDLDVKAKKGSMVELNISCPNVLRGNFQGSLLRVLATLEDLDLDNLVLGLKLQPFSETSDIEDVAYYVRARGEIKFLTCCNTIPNCLFIEEDVPSISSKLGGLGGRYVKPLSLSNVYRFSNLLDVAIFGCGGVTCGRDVYDYILCGATAVQVGTQLVKEGVSCFERIEREFKDIMKEKGYNSIEEFRGKMGR